MRKGLVIFFVLFIGGASLLVFKLWKYRQSKVHETRIEFPSGAILIHETDWWGREPFLNDSSPNNRLYIQWRSDRTRELVADSGWMSLVPADQCRLYHEASVILVQTPDAIYWRYEREPRNWRRWDLLTPKREPLYSYLRDRTHSDPQSHFSEVAQERGKRLTIPTPFSYTYIGDPEEMTWSLPYRFALIDFHKNTLIVALDQPVPGLPRQLVFSGPAETFGKWEFDSSKTAELDATKP
jgi:hypothetical protein